MDLRFYRIFMDSAQSGCVSGSSEDSRGELLSALRSKKVRAASAIIFGLMAASLIGLRATHSETIRQRPCDIYAAANTPCVAAHSTVRALFSAYSGNLYQVKRWSDSATTSQARSTASIEGLVVDDSTSGPVAGATVNLRPSAAGIDVLVRYVTRAAERFEMRNRLFQRVLDVLRAPGSDGDGTPANPN